MPSFKCWIDTERWLNHIKQSFLHQRQNANISQTNIIVVKVTGKLISNHHHHHHFVGVFLFSIRIMPSVTAFASGHIDDEHGTIFSPQYTHTKLADLVECTRYYENMSEKNRTEPKYNIFFSSFLCFCKNKHSKVSKYIHALGIDMVFYGDLLCVLSSVSFFLSLSLNLIIVVSVNDR